MMLLAIIIILASLIGFGQSEQTAEKPQVYCGRHLAEAHRIYCYGAQELGLIKRSNIPSYGFLADNRLFGAGASRDVYIPNALEYRRKRNPGLADECCLKACYVSELIDYC